jgi:pimeloyl-ACP methyl ester carboxylesterase
MNSLRRVFMPSPALWRATPPLNYTGPRIALIHGLLAGSHMERHLLRFLREAGQADTSLYSNHLNPGVIANDLVGAARAQRSIVLIGFSQGGFQILKVARHLAKKNITVDLAITLAAGGAGRFYPSQWGASSRRIPANVKSFLNYFAEHDFLGSDLMMSHNISRAEASTTLVENIFYPAATGITHLDTVRCFPPARVAPEVQELFLNRLLNELASLDTAP